MLGIAPGAKLNANASLNRDLDLLAALETPAMRWYLDWAQIERVLGSGVYDWTEPDAIIAGAISRDIESLIGIGTRGDGNLYNTEHLQAVARFAEAAARRYRPLAWEGVNEGFFTKVDPQPTAKRYLDFQRVLYWTVKTAQPEAIIGTGGIIGSADHLRELYSTATTSGIAPHEIPWDFVAWHAYTRPFSFAQSKRDQRGGWWAMLEARKVMVANHEAHKQMWMTEVGWNTDGPEAVSETDQALNISDAVGRFRRHAWAGPMFVFTGWDSRAVPPAEHRRSKGDSMGLYRADDSEKPAAGVFRELASMS